MPNDPIHADADIRTLKVLEDDERKYRIFLTMAGAIACERYNTRTSSWEHMPLRDAGEQELSDLLAARYQTADEEIARAIAQYSK